MEEIYLNVRTNFSLLCSVIDFKEYFKYAKNKKLTYLAICDNNMYGTYNFYKKCKNNNIIPIIGLNFYVFFEENNKIYNLNIFAINKKGYLNIVKISSYIMLNNNNNNNNIFFKKLINFLDDNLKIIINYDIFNFDILFYNKIISLFKNINNIYVGINYNNYFLLKKYNIFFSINQIIWNNKIFYLYDKDFIFYKVLNSIKKKIIYKNNLINNFFCINNINFNFKKYLFNNYNFAKDIVKYDLNLNNNNLKNFNSSLSFYDNEKYLLNICKKKLQEKINNNIINNIDIKKYYNRLFYELKIINNKKFSNYFLIVWDFVNYAKRSNIYVGPGRGSSCSSLVSFLLNITEIDPIKYNLLFERFLNINKKKYPDIDIDFEDIKRKDIFNYLYNKYGKYNVSNINIFQNFTFKTALIDLGFIFNINIDEINKIINLLLNNNISKNTNNYFFKKKIINFYNKKYYNIFYYLFRLIGFPKKIISHPSGIIISNTNLNKIIPIQKSLNNNFIFQTQFSSFELEELGLLKIDILGLKTLTIIHNIINNINNSLKFKNKFILNNIILNDKKTFDYISSGETDDIFQLNSYNIKKMLIDIKPKSIEDIAAIISLNKPSVKKYISLFIEKRKKFINNNNFLNINIFFKEILLDTYGIILYQEQILLIIQKVSNFSLSEADFLRIAICQKKINILNKIKLIFFKKSLKNNFNIFFIKKIWKLICNFSSYVLNKSHAIAYAKISYNIAYLRTHYLGFFFVEFLNNFINDEKKIFNYIHLIYKNNFKILFPSIDKPLMKFEFNNNGYILLPLFIIKKINYNFCNEIFKEYNNNGYFKDIFDFFIRLYDKGLDKENYKFLCYSNFFSKFNINSLTLYKNYFNIISYVNLVKTDFFNSNNNNILNNDLNLIERPELIYYDKNKFNKIILLKSYYYLNFYLFFYFLNKFRFQNKNLNNIFFINDLINLFKKNIFILCYILKIKKIYIKKINKKIIILSCFDETNSIKILVNYNNFKKYKKIFKKYNLILVKIKIIFLKTGILGILKKIKLIKCNF